MDPVLLPNMTTTADWQPPPAPGPEKSTIDEDQVSLVALVSEGPERTATNEGSFKDGGSFGRTSASKWKGAKRAVVQQNNILAMFRTLRDMHPEAQIQPEWITPLKATRAKSVLGEGAFAVVEKCNYQPPGASAPQLVAVKRLRAELLEQEEDLRLFIQEAALLRKLKNKHIVEYIGIGGKDDDAASPRSNTPDGPPSADPSLRNNAASGGSLTAPKGGLFLVQELMDGGTLRKLVQDAMGGQASYTNADALRWSLQMAQGLQYLHNALPPVIHRDLKLENVLLKGKQFHTSEAKIADFGLSALSLPAVPKPAKSIDLGVSRSASVLGAEEESMAAQEALWSKAMLHSSSSPALGRDGQAGDKSRRSEGHVAVPDDSKIALLHLSGRTGSFMYMAPEMYKCMTYDCSVDTYSFAVMLYELFGRIMMVFLITQHGSASDIERYAQRVSNGFRPPLGAPLFATTSLGKLIGDCWAQDPAKRPSMAQVVMRLEEIQASHELSAHDVKLCGCTIS